MDKVVKYAEEEQKRRDAVAKDHQGQGERDKIRVVRVSDLCVSHSPWHLVAVLANIVMSLVFRDQQRGENALLKSDLLDGIVLRPGDLRDTTRNETTTSLQVDLSGSLPEPAYVDRDDVASLAALLATSDLRFHHPLNTKIFLLSEMTYKLIVRNDIKL